jgi:hypothetical protein
MILLRVGLLSQESGGSGKFVSDVGDHSMGFGIPAHSIFTKLVFHGTYLFITGS